jgi:hypothetical protein
VATDGSSAVATGLWPVLSGLRFEITRKGRPAGPWLHWATSWLVVVITGAVHAICLLIFLASDIVQIPLILFPFHHPLTVFELSYWNPGFITARRRLYRREVWTGRQECIKCLHVQSPRGRTSDAGLKCAYRRGCLRSIIPIDSLAIISASHQLTLRSGDGPPVQPDWRRLVKACGVRRISIRLSILLAE